jgi:alpha-beta hydrolase superfamily lysophospholipase
MATRRATLGRAILWPLAVIGVVALSLGAMVAAPLDEPPQLASIHSGAIAISQDNKPSLSRFQARDGAWLAYRLYRAAHGETDRLAILAHGSSASSAEMSAVAQALAAAGVAAVAIDARGHGASGARGDIAYIGQLEDDLADLVVHLRADYPDARLTLVGHSSGGGFALRVASEPVGAAFDRFVLLAPYLGYTAPTNRPAVGAGRWASPDMPRVIALKLMSNVGLTLGQSLPAIAFANAPEARLATTSQYSYRLMANYGPPWDWRGALSAGAGRIALIAGERDELMDAAAYQRVIPPLGPSVTLLPDVDHMGIVHAPTALAAVVAAVTQP